MAKFALVIGLLSVSLNVAFGQDLVSGVLTYQRKNRVQADHVGLKCAAGETQKCQDCTTIMVCDGQGSYTGSIDCEGDNPYCNGNTCSNVAPAKCVTAAPHFKCTSDGYKPDPTYCNKYFYCKRGSVTKAYECPTGYYVNTILFMCQKIDKGGKDCVTMSCFNVTKPTMVLHPHNKSFYGYCATAASTPLMYSCISKGYKFNTATSKCEYKCTDEGNFPGKTTAQYVFCYKENEVYKYIEYECPTGLKYDEKKTTCA